MAIVRALPEEKSAEQIALRIEALEKEISELKGVLFALAQRLRLGYETIENERTTRGSTARLARWEDSWLVFLHEYEEKEEAVQAVEHDLIIAQEELLSAGDQASERKRTRRARAS